MARLNINLPGRVKNLNLKPKQALVPLYEAISNAIHAINEKQQQEKLITIKILRNQIEFESMGNDTGKNAPISGFTIEDNGIGLNGTNFSSFLTTDSTYKEKLGGKGVGRLSYLACFEKAIISSAFVENGNTYCRDFVFDLENNIDETKQEFLSKKSSGTTVELHQYKDKYAQFVPCNANEIAHEIIKHFLLHFLGTDCPDITLKDGENNYNLNALASKMFYEQKDSACFSIQDEEFLLKHILVKKELCKYNELVFFAHGRAVKKINLENEIADLKSGIKKSEQELRYIGIVEGGYLDGNVTSDRTALDIPKEDTDTDFITTISEKAIELQCVTLIEEYLKEALSIIREEKMKKYRTVIDRKLPQYKYLENYKKEELERIKPNLSEEKLEDELHKIDRELKKDTNKEVNDILSTLSKNKELTKDYKEKLSEVTSKLTNITGASLTEYVVRRKAVLQIFEEGLKLTDSDEFKQEEYLHQLIYPMYTTSEEISYEAHNLWLIDERLAFSRLIASEMALKDKKIDKKKRPQRTDLVVLDNPVVVSDFKNDETAFETITIFEFKKPMRDNYKPGHKDNPVDQLLEYLDKIQEGGVVDKHGRPVRINEKSRIYLYAVCDITKSLKKILKQKDFKFTLDGEGRYFYYEGYNAYMEIIPYSKIVKDAKMRNRVFFEKLGIDG